MRIIGLILLMVITGCATTPPPRSQLYECALACKNGKFGSFENETISCKCARE